MNEIIEKDIIDIEDKIFEIRGVQVMLSSVVAKLYHVETKRLDELFDKYIRQSFLDNGLRGGFPLKLGENGHVYYVYSRKHGDMERDYNNFVIPSKYYSSGLGNFRDVNQNRRSDLYYFPLFFPPEFSICRISQQPYFTIYCKIMQAIPEKKLYQKMYGNNCNNLPIKTRKEAKFVE